MFFLVFPPAFVPPCTYHRISIGFRAESEYGVLIVIRAFFADKKWALWAYGGGLFLLSSLCTQVYMTVLINEWYGGFYDMLQKAQEHSIDDLWAGMWAFLKIAGPYVVIATITGYFTRLYAFAWREAITFNYIPRWRNVTVEIEGASQRIQEDAFRFARIVESLWLQIVRAILTLAAFLPLLWALSDKVRLEWMMNIPHSLVWIAMATSGGGMLISWLVGIKLPGLEYNNQKVEARFRKELVYGEDDKSNHALPETLTELFTGVRVNYRRLYLHYGYFDVWSNMYDQLIVLVPYVMMGPGLFSGTVTLGILMQASNAFDKVHGSFALFINNWTTITELRSIHKRLREFEKNLDRHAMAV